MKDLPASRPADDYSLHTFVALLVLLVLTVGAGRLELGRWNLLVAVSIASLKAILILLVFMRVQYGTPLVRLFAVAGFFWFALLIGLTFSDYVTRESVSNHEQSGPLHTVNDWG